MFRREPDTRRSCPFCRKRIRIEESRYCDRCGQDFTGSTVVAQDVGIGTAAAESLAAVIRRYEGAYVRVNLRKAEEFEPVLLVAVRETYLTLSLARTVHTYPMSAIVSVLEAIGAPPVLVLHHEFIPTVTRGGGTWLGISMPLN